ncbi:MAG TPA: HDIG domain-containing protein [Bacteroidales bacterium]|nr:HDIG domain-containing protein [Bacteroidales bacterium]
MKPKKFRENLSQNLLKITFFVVAAILIVQSFPREGRFRYSFQEGKPWRYGLMTAPYDFQIYKTDLEIKTETDSVMQGFKPYLRMDTSLTQTVQKKLHNDFIQNFHETIPPQYLDFLTNRLAEIYSTGIISASDHSDLVADSVQNVLVLRNRMAMERPLVSIYTTTAAYEALFDNLPFNIHSSVLKTCKLNNYIQENLIPDENSNLKAKENFEKQVSQTEGLVQRGERIIDRGEIISPETFRILYSLKKVAEVRSVASGGSGVLIGQLVLVFGLFILQFLFLWFFRPFTYERKANVVFILILITGLVLITSLVVHTGVVSVYLIPYAILPIMIRTFFDSRTALFAHIITVLISSTIVASPYEFLLLQIAAGMTSVYSLRDLTQRSQLVLCAILVVLTYCVMYLGLSLIQEGFVSRVNWRMFLYFFVNGGLMLTSYLLIYFFEWLFGYTSNVTLVELSNMNNPLLREFSETCPGSFQHSLQVSNLATAAAQEINANVQLARTGALYHDIGKMSNPIYFAENQTGVNPHDKMKPEESAKMIASHVAEGMKLANKHGLPLVIRDFIRMHHGTGPIRYFYNNYRTEHPGEPVPACYFYTGVNPTTKETAILMMADALEASSRSLSEYNEENISKLVDKIINAKIQDGAFRDVPITFRDMEKVKAVFKVKLQSIYHTRIPYPEAPTSSESINS